MSGSELGRLMDEVTAHPPVDVELGAVRGAVARRRRRLRAVAASVTAVVVVAAIAVPLAVRGSSAGSTTSGSGNDDGWRTFSIDSLSWRLPPGWQQRPYVDDRRLAGPVDDQPVAVFSTGSVPAGCAEADAPCSLLLTGSDVFGGIVGSGSIQGQPPAPDPGTLREPDELCAAVGAWKSYTVSRSFRSGSSSITFTVDGCLGSVPVGSAPALLRRIAASLVDGGLPPSPDYRVQAGRFSWVLPNSWDSVPTSTADPGSRRRFVEWCGADIRAGDTGGCDNFAFGRLGPGATVGWFSSITAAGEAPDPLGRTSPPDPGCKQAGGSARFAAERRVGPTIGGALVQLTACLTAEQQQAQVRELRGILASFVEADYASTVTGAASPSLTTN